MGIGGSIEVVDLDEPAERPIPGRQASGRSRAPLVLLGLVVLAVMWPLVSRDDTRSLAGPTVSAEPEPWWGPMPSPMGRRGGLQAELHGLDVMLLGAPDGPALLQLDAVRRSPRPIDAVERIEGRVLAATFAGAVVQNGAGGPGSILGWDGTSSALGAAVSRGNLHVAPGELWYGGEGFVDRVDADGVSTIRIPIEGVAEVRGAHDDGALIWHREESVVRLVDPGGSATVVAVGVPVVGGEGWIGTARCQQRTTTSSCDLHLVDLVAGSEWVVADAVAGGSAPVMVLSSDGRRAVLGLGPGGRDVVLVDVDERTVESLALPAVAGTAFDPTDRFLLHPREGADATLFCALDLELAATRCVVPGVDFARVLVVPPADRAVGSEFARNVRAAGSGSR